MKDYYVIKSKLLKGFGLKDSISFNEYFKKNYEELYPNYLILEEINNNLYEIYTGIKIVTEIEAPYEKTLFYKNQTIDSLSRPLEPIIKPISDIDESECLESWIIDNNKKIEILKNFNAISMYNLDSNKDLEKEIKTR